MPCMLASACQSQIFYQNSTNSCTNKVYYMLYNEVTSLTFRLPSKRMPISALEKLLLDGKQ